MRHFHFVFTLLMLCLAGWGLTPQARGAEPRDLMSLLPANTLVAIELRDMPSLSGKWDASAFSRFYHDPRAEAFFRPLRRDIDGFERRLGIEHGRLWRFLNGQAVLAGVATSGGRDPMEWVILARHNGDPEVLARLQRPPAPPGSTLRRIPGQYQGFEITRFQVIRENAADVPTPGEHKKKKKKRPTLTAEDLGLAAPQATPGESQAKKQSIEEYEDYFDATMLIHAGEHDRPLHKILDRLRGKDGAATLVRQAEFVQAGQAAGGGGDVRIYVNTGRLAASFLRQDEKSMLLNWGGLGLGEIKAAALNLAFEPGRLNVSAALLAPPPRQGISRVLFLPADPAPDAAGVIPGNTIGGMTLNLPLPKLWGIAMQTLALVSPPVYVLLDQQFKAFEQGTGLKLEQALAGRMGSQVARFTLPGKEAGDAGAATTMLALGDGAAFRDALKALLDASGMLGGFHVIAGREGGWPVWTLVEGAPGAGAAGRPLAHLCVTDRWLLESSRGEGIEAAIEQLKNPSAPALQSQPFYRESLKQLPADRFATAVARSGGVQAVVQNLLDFIGDGDSKKKSNEKNGGMVNARRMPESRVWDEYFGPAAGALGRADDRLIRVKAFFQEGQSGTGGN